jgi:hypothetical protein
VSAAVLVLLSLSNASYAEDPKVYPGQACHALYESDAAGLTREANGIYSRQGNVYVSCPIVRDNVSNLDGTKDAVVIVWNEQFIVQNNVGCTLYSNTLGGATVATKSAVAALGGPLTLNVDVNASQNGGYYNLHCWLPIHSGILSYRITEY